MLAGTGVQDRLLNPAQELTPCLALGHPNTTIIAAGSCSPCAELREQAWLAWKKGAARGVSLFLMCEAKLSFLFAQSRIQWFPQPGLGCPGAADVSGVSDRL